MLVQSFECEPVCFDRQRDKTDEVASTVAQFAEAESVNHTLQAGLQGFASCFSAIGDHR